MDAIKSMLGMGGESGPGRITTSSWGSFAGVDSGEAVDATLYTITNGGITAAVTDLGATLVQLLLPDKDGEVADCVLGYDSANVSMDPQARRSTPPRQQPLPRALTLQPACVLPMARLLHRPTTTRTTGARTSARPSAVWRTAPPWCGCLLRSCSCFRFACCAPLRVARASRPTSGQVHRRRQGLQSRDQQRPQLPARRDRGL